MGHKVDFTLIPLFLRLNEKQENVFICNECFLYRTWCTLWPMRRAKRDDSRSSRDGGTTRGSSRLKSTRSRYVRYTTHCAILVKHAIPGINMWVLIELKNEYRGTAHYGRCVARKQNVGSQHCSLNSLSHIKLATLYWLVPGTNICTVRGIASEKIKYVFSSSRIQLVLYTDR